MFPSLLLLSTLLPFTFPILHLHPQAGTKISVYNPTLHSAEIRVTGDGMGDVDCYLYGRDGQFLESDTGSNDSCLLTAPSRMPGRYRVLIVNEGGRAGVYSITVTAKK